MKTLEYALKMIRQNGDMVNGYVCESLRKNRGMFKELPYCDGCVIKETFKECSNPDKNKTCGALGIDWEGMFAKEFRKKKLSKLLGKI